MVAGPYADRVNRVMDHIRANLGADLNLNELAKVAYLSPYHFHRIFKVTAGETVAEFTRRARLERAAYLMKASPERQLGSIALDAGFASASELSRSFRRHYGVAPSDWDRCSRIDAVVLPPADKSETSLAEPVQARVVDHPACRLAYIRIEPRFFGDQLVKGYEQLTRWLEEQGVAWRQSKLLGMSWDHYETTPLDQVRFDFGFVVPPSVAAQGEIGTRDLPAIRSVDAHSCGSLARIKQIWDYLYQQWLPASPYEPADLPAMKRFHHHPDQLGWQHWDLDCSIPLRPRLP